MANRICWNCGVESHMTYRPNSKVSPRASRWHTADAARQGAFACDNCGFLQIAFGRESVAGFPDDNFNSDRITWMPQVGVSRHFADVPEHIDGASSEAYRCFSIGAYRGAAGLARGVIEATAKHKGIEKSDAYAAIEGMAEQQIIRDDVKEAAHEVRHLGNAAAHGDFVDPIERDEAEEILELMAEVLEEVYTGPARVARVKAAREAKRAQS